LFRKKAKAELVATAHRLLIVTLSVLGLVVVGVVLLIFDVVVSRGAGFVAGDATLLAIIAIWVVLPRVARPDRTSQHR
jgi:predicted nucleic acid-binding Zn ribbon protein